MLFLKMHLLVCRFWESKVWQCSGFPLSLVMYNQGIGKGSKIAEIPINLQKSPQCLPRWLDHLPAKCNHAAGLLFSPTLLTWEQKFCASLAFFNGATFCWAMLKIYLFISPLSPLSFFLSPLSCLTLCCFPSGNGSCCFFTWRHHTLLF